jgi:membrane-anchored glycerophosphoryl diester phosphodiesterase (GDPDase)
MTKKDFFILMIKLFGLSSAVTNIFSVIPNNIAYAISYFDLVSILWIAGVSAIIIGLFILLVFKAEAIVEFLRLERGFEETRIELGNLNSSDVIKIGTFIIGGLMIIRNIPWFLSNTYWAFKNDIAGIPNGSKDSFNWAVNGLNLIFGYVLITNYDLIVKRFKRKEEK